tara:strand:+ start:377 stop:2230 length:1854 start_codon:yes stop_codon:yes gene_type:complete
MRNFLSIIPILLSLSLPLEASWWDFSKDCEKKEYSTKVLTEKSKPGVLMINTDKATGSGFVVRHVKNKTLILTNSHVIEGAKQITVQWLDGNQDNAKVVLDAGGDTSLTDLALLEIDGKEGTVLTLKKKQAIVGRDVIAIGSPRGLGFTLTKGVISSLRDKGKIVQTDTAINPGSSGGPLINASGCVVGVNTFKSIQEGDEGLNFAISSQTAQRFVNKYLASNKKEKNFKDSYDENITKENIINKNSKTVKLGVGWITNSENYPEITFVLKNSNAEKAGLKVNDIILSIDGQTTNNLSIAEIGKLVTNENNFKAKLKVRRNEKKLNLVITKIDIKDVDLNPEDYKNKGEAYAYKGFIMLSLEKNKLGVENLEKALEFDLRNERKLITYINLAIAKTKLKDFEGAVSAVNNGLKLNPKNNQKEWVYETIGFAKSQLKDYQGALNDYNLALEFNITEERTPIILGNRALAKANLKDYKGASKDFKKAFEFELNTKQKEWLFAQLGFLKGQTGDYQEAIVNFSEAIKLNTNKDLLANLYTARCWNNLKLEIYQSAIDDCNEAIKINPKDFNAFANRGGAFSGIFLHREACFDYKKSHALGNQEMGKWLNSRQGKWCRNSY